MDLLVLMVKGSFLVALVTFEFNEMVEKFKEPFKPYWTPCIELFLW